MDILSRIRETTRLFSPTFSWRFMLLWFATRLNTWQRELLALWSCLQMSESGESLSKRPILWWDRWLALCMWQVWLTLRCAWIHGIARDHSLYCFTGVFSTRIELFQGRECIMFIGVSLWLAGNIGVFTRD